MSIPGALACVERLADKARKNGIAEGLRMAAEMFRNSKWQEVKGGHASSGYDIHELILAKAKEVEEAKGGK